MRMFYLGMCLTFIGGLWIVVNAFRNGGVLWGVGSLLVPLVGLVYGLLNFAENKLPLVLYAAGIVLCVIGWGSIAEQAALQGAMSGMPQQ
jgi:hypothetical protein